MNDNQALLTGGLERVLRNKRYVVWFYILSVLLGLSGTMAFVTQAGAVLDHSLRADGLLHGLDLSVLIEMLIRPEFGPTLTSSATAILFASLFWLATALFLPGVLQGYASRHRLPREDFFRACGRNLWRFIRLMIVAGIVMGIVAGALFWAQTGLLNAIDESTYELLPFYVSLTSLFIIFMVITALRIWFDLAQADVVLSDQGAVRRSIGAGFHHTRRNLGQLLGSYIVATLVAVVVLVAGLWVWLRFVPPASLFGALVVSQLTLLLLLIPRFWQRGVAVTYYLQNMVEPLPAAAPALASSPAVAPAIAAPSPALVIPNVAAEPQGS